MTRPTRTLALTTFLIAAFPLGAAAQERLCDTQLQDCRAPLIQLIRNETVGIDVAFWYLEDGWIASELISRHQGGLPIRILMDERANTSHPANAPILDVLRESGLPMREKLPDYSYSIQILHFKMMLFDGQNVVEFSKANYSSAEFVPYGAHNYSDEAVFFTDDYRLTNSFRRRFDDMWTDTTVHRNYANINGPLGRRYDMFPIDASLNFPPEQDFADRSVDRFDHEPQGIDAIVFRATDSRQPDAMIRAVARGVAARLITDYPEYRNRLRRWDAVHKDRMWIAGVQMKVATHAGIMHEGAVVLHGLGEAIFGSSNWTMASAIQQDEHNWFYEPSLAKQWFFDWFVSQFNRKWNDDSNYAWFVPLPPDAPSSVSPQNAASGLSSTVTLRFDGGPWAHFYDIYLGTTPDPALLASGQQLGSVDDGVIETYTVTGLQPGTTYYWRVVGKTYAQVAATGPVWSFTTSGTTPGGGSTPHGGTPATIPGTFQAEDFDDGGQGVAYNDLTSTNSGGAYRPAESVDIQATTDAGGGYNIGWTGAGEWLKYTVDVTASGTYQLESRVATIAAGASFRIEVDDVDRTGPIAVPNTGGWQAWQTIITPGIGLTAGLHVIRVVFITADSSGYAGNYNWFRLGSAPSAGATIPGTVQAENFDEGGQGVAYYDTTPGNAGGLYRSTDVDLESTTDTGGGFNVMKTRVGEWLKYTINATAPGTYPLSIRIASVGTGGVFHVEVDGENATGALAVPDTGGWQQWQTITTAGVWMSAGQHVMRVVFDVASSSGGVGNYNWFRFAVAAPTSNTPHGGTPATIPGTFQAEDFDDGGQGVAYNDLTSTNSGGAYRPAESVDIQATTDAGGGFNIGWTGTGEWLKYTVNVSASGTYQLESRVATIAAGASFRIEVDDVDCTGPIAVPNTGGWQSWQTISTPGIALTAGLHVIRVVFVTADSSGYAGNYNWFRLAGT